MDQKAFITNILKDLDEWRLRISWLDLHLMYEQLRTVPSDLNQWLKNVAQAVISVLCNVETNSSEKPDKTRQKKVHSMNLIAPLISKLPRVVQAHVLQVSSEVLNAVNFCAYSSHKPPAAPTALPGVGGGLGTGGMVGAGGLGGLVGQGTAATLVRN